MVRLLACLVLLFPCVLSASQPNIVVILADDLGYREVSYQGGTVPTPNIDSIARNGVRFTCGYTANPLCGPSRAAIMTGRYPTRFGIETNAGGVPGSGLPLTETTLATRLKDLGYDTCCIGKWDLGAWTSGGTPNFLPTYRGFDEFYGTASTTNYFQPTHFIDSRIHPSNEQTAEPNFYTTDAFAARAVEWINGRGETPFFLYLAFNAPHSTTTPDVFEAPDYYQRRFSNLNGDITCKYDERRDFAAVVSALDDGVGDVLSALRTKGIEDDTIVVFLSDNGAPSRGNNQPFRGSKGMTLEGGICIPFAIQWPGHIAPSSTCEHPVISTDIVPTAVAAAGGAVPANIDGRNLVPLLTGSTATAPHDVLFWRIGDQFAIQRNRMKLVSHRLDEPGTIRLHNLRLDSTEANDLYSTETALSQQLKAEWDSWNIQQAPLIW